MVEVGSQITARITGLMRGATVLKVNDDESILVECWCPKRNEFTIQAGRYQYSGEWNNPRTRQEV
jgi:hypothetical protein